MSKRSAPVRLSASAGTLLSEAAPGRSPPGNSRTRTLRGMVRSAIADDPTRTTRRLLRRLSGRGAEHAPGEDPCRILVGGAATVSEVEEAVAAVLDLPESAPLVRHGGLAWTIGRNAHAGSGDDERWPFSIELRPEEPVPHTRYVEAASGLLRGLWERGWRAVAFCSFADDLPRQDGSRWSRGRRV